MKQRMAACTAMLRAVLGGRVLLPALLLAGGAASAHKPSDAYLTLQIDGALVQQRLDIALRDLDRELLLDADDDGALAWGEVRKRWDDIALLAERGVAVQRAGRPCARQPDAAAPQLQRHSDGTYAVLRTRWRCPGSGAIGVDYRLFADTDPTHRGIVRLLDGQVQLANAVLVPGAAPRVLAAPLASERVPASAGIRLADFFAEGVHHILAGTDHLLFLIALLLPAVWRRVAAPPGVPARWEPAPALAPALREVAGVVTAFTLAHSLTLALSTLSLLSVPSRWVESLIALSIVFAALNNLRPMVQRDLWLLAFGFGLVHGIGFAGVLADVGLSGRALLPPLLAFNLGVEAGQLMIVAGWLLLAWPLRRHAAYGTVSRWGSWGVAAVATVWLAERALLMQLLP